MPASPAMPRGAGSAFRSSNRTTSASATSSASSKLVHGGLRYLEQLHLRLVRESLVERSTLIRIAGHLVRPLPFLAPIYDDAPRSRVWMQLGLTLYDLLATGHSLGRHRWLNPEEVLEREPSLNPEGLRGAFLFFDAQMNDARLCLENILSARQHGAQVRNYTPVDELIVDEGRVCGVRFGNDQQLRARVVLNAAGPVGPTARFAPATRRTGAAATGPRIPRGHPSAHPGSRTAAQFRAATDASSS